MLQRVATGRSDGAGGSPASVRVATIDIAQNVEFDPSVMILHELIMKRIALTGLAFFLLCAASSRLWSEEFSITGDRQPQLQAFDAWMQSFMTEHQIPGGSLAIV